MRQNYIEGKHLIELLTGIRDVLDGQINRLHDEYFPDVTPDLSNDNNQSRVHAVVELVADTLQLKIEDIYSHSHQRVITDARHVVVYLCVRYLKISNLKVCRILNRNHASGLSAIKKVEGLLSAKDKEFTTMFKMCEEAFFKEFLKV